MSNIIPRTTLAMLDPKRVAELLSAARSEFLASESYSEKHMQSLTEFLGYLARELYRSEYQWSEYNKGQWKKFVSLEVGIEGGTCMFSLELDGELPRPLKNSEFRGLGIGSPVGIFPYAIFPVMADKSIPLGDAITKYRKYAL